MARISAALALLLPVWQDDPRLEELKAADRERIRSRDSLTRLEQELYTSAAALAPWSPAAKALSVRARVIPVGFRDRPAADELSWLGSLKGFLAKQSGGALRAEIEVGPSATLSRAYADALSLSKNSTQESDLVAEVARSVGLDPSKQDALILVYPGGLVRNRQSVLWPHQASIAIVGKPLRYTIAPAEGSQAAAIHAHEFLHLFGLADKPSNRHCILAFGYEMIDVCGGCRALLGWAKIGSVDASKETRVSVGELSRFGEVARIEVSRTGEALLVELRGGLLIVWHDLRGQLDLVASLDGRSADRLTPHSSPGFRGRSRGSVPVYLTDLTIDAEMQRAFFKVSGRGEPTELEKHLMSRTGRSLGRDQ
jgi:hypothetical protein